MTNNKMYIAALDEFPDYMVPTLVAHAVLGYHMEHYQEDYKWNIPYGADEKYYPTMYHNWLEHSFKKCVVRVNQKEFTKISNLPNVGLFHENKTLEGKKSCAVLVVDEDIPNVLKFAKLWNPKHE